MQKNISRKLALFKPNYAPHRLMNPKFSSLARLVLTFRGLLCNFNLISWPRLFEDAFPNRIQIEVSSISTYNI